MRIPKHIYIFAEYPYESKYLNVRHTWSYLSHTCLLCGGPRRGHGTWPQPGISPILMWWRRGDVMGTHGNIFPPSSCSQVGTMWGQNDGVLVRLKKINGLVFSSLPVPSGVLFKQQRVDLAHDLRLAIYIGSFTCQCSHVRRLVTSRENVSLQLQNKEDLMFSDWYN